MPQPPVLQAPGVVLRQLEIADAAGTVVRRYRSDDKPEPPPEGRNIPDYWIRPAPRLLATPGLHRFVWDVRYAPPAVDQFSYPIAAVARNTPKAPRGSMTHCARPGSNRAASRCCAFGIMSWMRD